MIEVSISVKNSEAKMTERHLLEQVVLSRHDDDLLKLVQNAISKFKIAQELNDPDYEVIIKGKLVWQS